MSVVGFSLEDAKRIENVVLRVEKAPQRTLPERQPTRPDSPRFMVRGKLTQTLTKGGTATMKVWRWDGTEDVETTETITIRAWGLKTGQTVASGKAVVATLDLASGKYVLTNYECP